MSIVENIGVLTDLAGRARDIDNDVRRLLEIREWALAQLPVSEGDKVTLKRAPRSIGPGWQAYREVLVKGSTGTVSDFYLWRGEWRGMFEPDVCWCISSFRDERFATEPKRFMLGLHYMRRRKNKDVGLSLPDGLVTR